MKLLVDTTYVLPAIGVAVKEVSERALLELGAKGHSISICTISLFELAAKGGKYIAERKLKAERVLRGLKAIASDETVAKVPYEGPHVLSLAFELRSGIADFIDCLILSAAVLSSDALVTEDQELRGDAGQGRVREIILAHKGEFKILSLKELLER